MTTADLILQGKADLDAVHAAGAKSEYDRMWDVLQSPSAANPGEMGKRNYSYAFAYGRFSDENYNPKYDIVCAAGATTAQHIFYQSAGITDTKVPIDASAAKTLNYAFQGCDGLVTIRLLVVSEMQTYTSTFLSCPNLENIRFSGTIGKDISFKDSTKLTPESVESIVTHLKDCSGTSEEFSYTVTIPNECWDALEAYKSAPDGGTWAEYVYKIGWNT